MAVDGAPPPNANRPNWIKPLAFLLGAAAIAGACYYFRRDLTLERLAHHHRQLINFRDEHPLLLPAIMLAVQAAAAALSLPIGVALSIMSGWLFGLWEGALLASFASTLGATLAFWISRYLLRDAISSRFRELLKRADELLQRDGALYLVSLRLVHVIPFELINLLMGWTKIRTTTFWWATQLGMLPATFFYVYIGDQVRRAGTLKELAENGIFSLLTWPRLGAFVLLAAIPLAIKYALDRPRK